METTLELNGQPVKIEIKGNGEIAAIGKVMSVKGDAISVEIGGLVNHSYLSYTEETSFGTTPDTIKNQQPKYKPTLQIVGLDYSNSQFTLPAPEGVLGKDWHIFDDDLCINDNVIYVKMGVRSLSASPHGKVRILRIF